LAGSIDITLVVRSEYNFEPGTSVNRWILGIDLGSESECCSDGDLADQRLDRKGKANADVLRRVDGSLIDDPGDTVRANNDVCDIGGDCAPADFVAADAFFVVGAVNEKRFESQGIDHLSKNSANAKSGS